MPILGQHLELSKCPHCKIDQPNLQTRAEIVSQDFKGSDKRIWKCYICSRCGGAVTAWAHQENLQIAQFFPAIARIDENIPDPARNYLQQANDSQHAPSGCIMLCASAVDSMLKLRGLKSGSLYSRIDQAATEHLITLDMAKWAHQVRLEANEQRHADESFSLPTAVDARRCLEFTDALGEFLFVLPSRVTKGIESSDNTNEAKADGKKIVNG